MNAVEMGRRPTALVVGANGLVGRNLATRIAAEGAWRTIGIARSFPREMNGVEQLAVDLRDAGRAAKALQNVGPVDYVFYAALSLAESSEQQARDNVELLANVVQPLTMPEMGLKHVSVVHGTKWYGSHLGPFRTPATESDPRLDVPLFYYDQHDWLRAAADGADWNFSTLRPHLITGINVGNPNNIVNALGVYVAMKSALDEEPVFPGTQACFDSLCMATNVSLLNEAMIWAATDPACAGEDFNITNGDYFRWSNLWPVVTGMLGTSSSAVGSISLEDYMSDKAPVWARIAQERRLPSVPFQNLVNWRWADFVFASEWDELSSTIKARQFGFHKCLDTEADFVQLLEQSRRERIIP